MNTFSLAANILKSMLYSSQECLDDDLLIISIATAYSIDAGCDIGVHISVGLSTICPVVYFYEAAIAVSI